ncbi:MAG: PhzF family phenazine biosynthesis protein [Coriobacteriia bacterium]|nr:PhzF family phenazine biosynthesis protein [Coriobacteriia bacterium]
MYRFMIVDVFTDTPLAGNQLAVFSNATGMSDELMQRLAAEMGFSETTFVLPPEDGGNFRIRIFTTKQELPFAGHPVLGTAFALAGPLQSVVLRIETRAGIVPVAMEREGAKLVYGRMEQPVPTIKPLGPAAIELFEALGVPGSTLPVEEYDNGIRHVYVGLESFAEVAAVKPDIGWVGAIIGDAAVNTFAVEDGKVKTRMFSPELGSAEDAATGSAAGPLAAHLARHGVIPWGTLITISQGAEIGRPSTLYASAEGDGDTITRVEVGGVAAVVARGEFSV